MLIHVVIHLLSKKTLCAITELLTVRVQHIQGESNLNYCKMLAC